MRTLLILLALAGVAHADDPYRRAPTCAVPRPAPPGPSDVVVTPALGSWSAVRQLVTEETRQILLTPGDYRGWNHLDIGPTWPSGSASAPIVIRYYAPDADAAHPVDRAAPATEAVIHGILWWGDVHDYVVIGLTVRAPAGTVANGLLHVLNADRVTLDRNLIEDSPQQFGVRIRDSSGVCVQRNVIRNGTNPTNDHVGLDVKPNTTDVIGLRILDNEITDWIDAVQLTNQAALRVGAVIKGNRLVTTSARHVQDGAGLLLGCTENGIDIKTPAAGGIYVVDNDLSGWLETPPIETAAALCGFHVNGPSSSSGSAGDAIIVHVDATDVHIVGNRISDSIAALRATNRVGGRRIQFVRNHVTNVPPPAALTRFYGGPDGKPSPALVLEDDTLVNGNVFDGVSLLCPRHGYPYPNWPPAGYNPAPPRVLRNVTTRLLDAGACSAAELVEETR